MIFQLFFQLLVELSLNNELEFRTFEFALGLLIEFGHKTQLQVKSLGQFVLFKVGILNF